MATVRDILAAKGAHVESIGPEATALDAAVLMNEHKIGSLVVLDGGQLAGIVTERDVLQRVVAQRRRPADDADAGLLDRAHWITSRSPARSSATV